MELTLRLGGGTRIAKISGETVKDLFQRGAQVSTVFNETHCGLCGSQNIRLNHRVAQQKYHYYEYLCDDCGAHLHMGQLQDGSNGLFPVRKLLNNGKPDFANGTFGDHNGWTRHRGDDSQDGYQEQQQRQQESASPFEKELSRFCAQIKKQTGVESERDVDKILRFATKSRTLELIGIPNQEQLDKVRAIYSEMQNRFREATARAAELWDFLCVGGLEPTDGSGANLICQWVMSNEECGFTAAVTDPKTFDEVIARLGNWYTDTPPAERKEMLKFATEWKNERKAASE